MLTFRDFVIVAALVALIVYLLRKPAGCGCGSHAATPTPRAPQPPATGPKRSCIGGLPCGGR